MTISISRRATGLALGLTLILVLAAGLLRMSSAGAAAPDVTPIVQSASADDAAEADFAAREATYGQQIEQLDQLLAERRSVYEMQVEEMKSRVKARQAQLDQLIAQEQALQDRVDELAGVRSSQSEIYQEQLQSAQDQYGNRMAELSARLSEAQAKLVEANTLLNR